MGRIERRRGTWEGAREAQRHMGGIERGAKASQRDGDGRTNAQGTEIKKGGSVHDEETSFTFVRMKRCRASEDEVTELRNSSWGRS